MSDSVVITAVDGGVCTITMNRPERKNAMSPDFTLGLMTDVKADPLMFRPTASVSLPVWREKIAATIAALLGEDWNATEPRAAPVIDGVLRRK